jgi:RNA polymerase sigma-70 factor (ECF subfamily)
MSDGLATLLAKNRAELLGFVEKRVGDRAVAEDILQDAAKRGLERADTVREDTSVRAWFYQGEPRHRQTGDRRIADTR